MLCPRTDLPGSKHTHSSFDRASFDVSYFGESRNVEKFKSVDNIKAIIYTKWEFVDFD